MNECSLCSSKLGPKIAASAYWRLILNLNQNLLGKCFWVLNRHLETITTLTPDEWIDLQHQINRATIMLEIFAKPDHFNYAFLQNQDRHVHLHIIPRYSGLRTFAGVTFDDPDYPGHYGVAGPARRLAQEKYIMMADELRQTFAQAVDGR